MNQPKDRVYPVSAELQDLLGLSEASEESLRALGVTEREDSTVLVDNTDSILVFLYRGVWRVLGTNGL